MELRICTRCSKAHPGRTHCPHCQEPLSLRDTLFLEGRTFGKYRIEKLIGAGGMGAVFRAVHETLHTPVALKIVLQEGADESAVKRFLREARLHAQLRHPNIVEVHDCDVGEFDIPYYVMEFLEGRSLRELIAQRPEGLTYFETCAHVRPIAAALHFAHRHGVVHRDLKPENVFVVSYEGDCVDKLLDFGIAKTVAGDRDTTKLTGTGAVIGTPAYLAPEQLTNTDVGPHTDQYALGLLVAELLTGRMVREGKSLGEIVTHEVQRPVSLELLQRVRAPEHAKAAIVQATQPQPANRFPGVRAFAAAFLGEDASGIAATRPSGVVPPRPSASLSEARTAAPATVVVQPRRRKRRVVLVATLCIVALAAGLAAARVLRSHGGAAAGAARPTLERLRALRTPPEALRLAGGGGRVFALAGQGTLYSVADADGAVPAPLALPAGAEWIGPATGGLLLRQGDKLFVRNLVEGHEETPVDGLPPGHVVACSASGGHCAYEKGEALEVCGVAGETCTPLFEVAERPADVRAATMTDRYFALVAGERLRVFDLRDGKPALEAPMAERRINAIAIQGEAGLVAVGGWFDGVRLFRVGGGEPQVIEHRGQVYGLAFLPEGPALAVAGDGGLQLWREGDEFFAAYGAADAVFQDVLFAGDGLAAFDKQRGELLSFAYRGFPARERVRTSTREVWALAAEPGGKRIFAGSSDGKLYVHTAGATGAEQRALHGQGVTALVVGGGYMASASDDKTVAVWKLPELSVVWRSRAHEFLVNWLYLQEARRVLWSSSSDGKVKRWRWPELEELETVDTGKHSVAAAWADEAGDLVLAGTWNHALVVARKGADGWKVAEEIPVRSLGLYWMVPLPGLELVVFVGSRPGAVFAYDLRAGKLFELSSAEGNLSTAVAEPDGRGVIVFGAGLALRYAFARRADGTVSYSIAGHVNTDLGTVLAAANLPDGHGLVVGNERGEVWQLDRADLHARPLAENVPLTEP